MTIQLDEISQLPALACTLQGGYLIEASAGTGKTWTLTGIILRLLIEKQYAPERIIATTFTRAAARELQERVQKRLSEFYHYIYWLNSARQSFPHWFEQGVFAQKHANDVINEIANAAKNQGIGAYDDPINLHLIVYLLSADAHAIQIAIHRISLLLATLDKLFIGTLDSLAQKWLKEFASEISYQTDTQISTDSDVLTRSLIHDALRREHFFMTKSSPRLYRLIGADIFSDIDGALKAVNLALQFYSAPIDETAVIDDGVLDKIDAWLDEFLALDLSVFEPFYEIGFAADYGLNASLIFTKNFALLDNIIALIRQHKGLFVEHLNNDEKKWIEKLVDIDNPRLFKKEFAQQKQAFLQLPVDYLLELRQQTKKINHLKQRYQSYLYRKIAIKIRQQLKTQLESMGRSTFTFQMVRLVEALEIKPSLARHIQYLYPVMLIDESQDINGLQVELIYHVYLTHLAKAKKDNKKTRGFLLLVGDPKQAIFRFRGGDVANYTLIKNHKKYDGIDDLLNCSLSLTVNRRSNSRLIQALNRWFTHQQDTNKTKNNHAYLGSGIFYQQISAANSTQRLSWQNMNGDVLPDYLNNKPISVLSLGVDDGDEFFLLAKHINSVLQGNHTLLDDNGICRTICAEDIAILSRDKKRLQLIKERLHDFGIGAISPSDVNIFSTQAAKDLYHLLSLVMDSANQQKMGSVLTSSLFGMSLAQSIETIQNHGMVLAIYLKNARELFYDYGVASCLNYCFGHNPFKHLSQLEISNQETLWQQIAKQGQRYLADIWQLTELIIRQDSLNNNRHELYLFSWFKNMMCSKEIQDDHKQIALPNETGVNLMSIHKAKGLEFAIVYVLGLEKAPLNTDDVFYPYSDEQCQRRISANAGNDLDSEFFKNKNYQEEIDEAKRLGYVALTRAAEQVFVVAKDLRKKEKINDRPLFLWFENTDKTLSLPERLIDDVGWINIAHCQDLIDQPYQAKEPQHHLIDYKAWHDVFKIETFYGTHTTSATALMNQYSAFTDKKLAEDEIFIDVTENADGIKIAYQPNDIRQNFDRGTNAGTFLHTLLQFVGTADKKAISHHIDQIIKNLSFNALFSSDFYLNNQTNNCCNDGTLQKNHLGLVEWIWLIVHQPMMASKIALASLDGGSYVQEMEFVIGVNPNFSIKKLNDVFEKYSDKPIVIDDENPNMCYQFLKGEIDLLYEHGGKFYVVDYKSNYVGSYLSDYCQETLELVMQRSGYWLQACIYQVALHRLLKIRIDDYVGNERHYLGGVEFIFLRGINDNYPDLGHICWQVPVDLILAMDRLFDGNEVEY